LSYHKTTKPIILIILSCVWCVVPVTVFAEWVPFAKITLEEVYDSNIFLDPDDFHRSGANKSDFRTNITPIIGLKNETDIQKLSAEYVFNYSYFINNSDQSYVGHAGNFDFERQLTQRLKIYLEDRLAVSEEPRTDSYDYVTVNYGRRRNLTNNAMAGVEYALGPESTVKFFYVDQRLDYLSGNKYKYNNEIATDYSSDDSVTYGPGIESQYWFNIRHGVLFSYQWQRTDYKYRASERRDHLNLGYMYRFSPYTSARCNFILDYVDSKDPFLFDYKIYKATVGFMKALSQAWTIDVFGGFYYRPSDDVPDIIGSSDNKGFSGGITLSYTQEYWHATLKGEAGARVEYGDYNNRGYTPFRSISADFGYMLTSRLKMYVKASYDYEKSPDTALSIVAGDNRRETYNVVSGFDYKILPWLSSRAEYEFAKESATEIPGTLPTGYTDHKVLISLIANYDWL